MKVKLTGYTRFTTKEGRDCCIIGFLSHDLNWNGLRVNEKFINPNNIGCELKPGTEYNFDFDSRGQLISIEPLA
jgi:hypothetical protein